MVKKLLADLSDKVVEEAQNAVQNGLKPALKFGKDQVANTLDSLGKYEINFNPSQIKRLVTARKTGKGLKLTLTDAQTKKVKQGGFLGTAILGSLAAPVIGSVVGEIGKAVRGKGMDAGGNHNGLGGGSRGMTILPLKKRMALGSGLFLNPPMSGGGILDTMFPGANEIHKDIVGIIQKGALDKGIKGMGMKGGIPVTRKMVGNIIKNLTPAAERIGTKVILDQLNNKSISATGTKGGAMTLKYGNNKATVHGGFLGNLVKTVGNLIPF